MSFALLPTTLTMLCAGMAGIFLVLGVLVLGVYLLNKVFQEKEAVTIKSAERIVIFIKYNTKCKKTPAIVQIPWPTPFCRSYAFISASG